MDTISTWLQTHDRTIDLVSVWVVVISALLTSAGLFTAWWTLRVAKDQTRLGTTLKWQKASLAVAFAVNALYWGTVLFAYYTGTLVSLWGKVAIRFLFAGGAFCAAVFVLWFAVTLRRQINVKQ